MCNLLINHYAWKTERPLPPAPHTLDLSCTRKTEVMETDAKRNKAANSGFRVITDPVTEGH